MSPAPLQEQSNGAHDAEGSGSKQRQSTTGTIPKASAKTNRQRMSTMAAEAASTNDTRGGSLNGGGEDATLALDAVEPLEPADRAGGEMRYVYGDSDQDHHMPPPMADFSRLRIRQDNPPSLQHHRHHHQQQPWRINATEHTAEMGDGGADTEAGSAGRRRQLLDSIPSQQILMVRKRYYTQYGLYGTAYVGPLIWDTRQYIRLRDTDHS